MLSYGRIIFLLQANIWFASRFILYLFNKFYALGLRLNHLFSQSLAALLALLTVLGNLRHPLSRTVIITVAFTTLWIYTNIPIYLSLPAVVFAGGVAEHYFPTIEVPCIPPFEVISLYTPRQKVEMKEI